eukprot:CAMPEP_0206303820 /NCGR_PEP_ID=MMETSP0106_2-20121207/9431_1 /ASSEMBLY_ACC=CAM_ASM_000206 /TAXON_ID=81532 /ORGANISM="Acanthoeca-like sp., Strain 10tr" /LENGTH=163 /DNA_ID=CAMNT_0053734621 /DNA_START=299 /DNA_END=786 /DNA_ORIENTATION=-
MASAEAAAAGDGGAGEVPRPGSYDECGDESNDESDKVFEGDLTAEVCEQIALGALVEVTSQHLRVDAGSLARALVSLSCRVRHLDLEYNDLGAEGGKAIAAALQVNSTITTINLRYNGLGAEGGKAIAAALQVNSTITTIDLRRNNLGADGGKAIAAALQVNS